MVKVSLNTKGGYPVKERTVNRIVLFSAVVVAIGFIAAIAYLSVRSVPSPPGRKLPGPRNRKPGSLSAFRITAPERAVVGEEFNVSIIAINRHGRPLTTYVGAITIKSDLISLPARSRYFISDMGKHHYRVMARAPGTAYIEVDDSAKGIIARSGPIVIVERWGN